MRTHSDGKRFPKVFALKLITIIILLLVAVAGHSEEQNHRLSEADILQLLSGQVSSADVAQEARKDGISFQITASVEGEIRRAGGTDELLNALRSLAPAAKPDEPSQPAPSNPVLMLTSVPGECQVYIDNEPAGSTSSEGRLKLTQLTPGPHTVRVSHSGFRDEEVSPTLTGGESTPITVSLQQIAPSQVSVSHSPIRVRMRSEAAAARLIKNDPPVYPPLARSAGIQGTVHLGVLLGTDGSVMSATVLSGDRLLVRAAVDAVQKYRYQPFLVNGQAVEVSTFVDVKFALNTESSGDQPASPSGDVRVGVSNPAPVSCQAESTLRSPASSKSIHLRLVNASTGVRKVYWINFAGQRTAYATLKPGASYVQQTYASHIWLIADQSETCLAVYQPLDDRLTITIER